MISKAANNRIYPLSKELIENKQNVSMKGRNIRDNIRLLFDNFDYANHEKMPGSVS